MNDERRLEEEVPEMVRRIVQTYAECSGIHHLDADPLPSKDAIVQILDLLFELVYPGFGKHQPVHLTNVEFHVGELLLQLGGLLTKQIGRTLRHENKDPTRKVEEFERIAGSIVLQFFETLPELRKTLREDVRAAFDGDPAASGFHEIVFSYPGLKAVTIYRIAHQLLKLGVPLMPRMMTELAHSLTGIDIHPGAVIGKRFFIDHGTGVVIGQTCILGDSIKIYQGVTLGALSFPKDSFGNLVRGTKRHPTIESNVVIYANATVLGGETVVGHDSIIGSNVWLTESIAPHTIVTMEKPNLQFRGADSAAWHWTV